MTFQVQLRRRLEATIERVFAAFYEPALVASWLRPSPDVTLRVLELDFRVGGRYRFAYHMADGLSMVVGGTYRHIEAPNRIVFTWVIEPPDEHAGIESLVTVALVSDARATELTITHAGWDRMDARERHAAGWQGALEQLVTHLAERSQP